MNYKNYKYGIIVDDNGIMTIHNFYPKLEDARDNLKKIMAETTLHTVSFPIGIKMYIFEIHNGITFTEIVFKD